MERLWTPDWALDVGMVLAPRRHGGGDPTFRTLHDGSVWLASRTPDGPGTLRVSVMAGTVCGQAWGPGAWWLLEGLPGLLGAFDDVSGFIVKHEVLRDVARKHAGLRIGRTGLVMEALVPAVLEQKVVLREARRAWRWLISRYGSPAPGPAPEGLLVVPEPVVWRQIPTWHWHKAGAEAVRAKTIATAAWHVAKLEAAPTTEELDRLLRALPGIGVWTSAEVRQRVFGDPDAVSVGDYHLANHVGYALTGQKVDDAEMMRLLAPYEGHRHRATILIGLTGLRPPPRGPRVAARDYRSI